tara:strand:+ start:483 stop:1097 length:615 start_codon:yes stop_codon:yes gene_type:complete
MIMKVIIITFFLCASIFSHAQKVSPDLFFDLGETLIHTDLQNSMTWMKGAENYVSALKGHNYSLGLIVNIPPQWGKTQQERVDALKSYVNSAWREARPFPWDWFNVILVPNRVEERKPSRLLFDHALHLSGSNRVIFQGESLKEIETSHKVGFSSFWIGSSEVAEFLPIEMIETFARDRSRGPFTLYRPSSISFLASLIADAIF